MTIGVPAEDRKRREQKSPRAVRKAVSMFRVQGRDRKTRSTHILHVYPLKKKRSRRSSCFIHKTHTAYTRAKNSNNITLLHVPWRSALINGKGWFTERHFYFYYRVTYSVVKNVSDWERTRRWFANNEGKRCNCGQVVNTCASSILELRKPTGWWRLLTLERARISSCVHTTTRAPLYVANYLCVKGEGKKEGRSRGVSYGSFVHRHEERFGVLTRQCSVVLLVQNITW